MHTKICIFVLIDRNEVNDDAIAYLYSLKLDLHLKNYNNELFYNTERCVIAKQSIVFAKTRFKCVQDAYRHKVY